jgi:putative tryptophan/tyrosine transport system substrate-binding protein
MVIEVGDSARLAVSRNTSGRRPRSSSASSMSEYTRSRPTSSPRWNTGRSKGLVVFSGALFSGQPRRIVELAAQARVPTIYPYKYFVDEGGMISYGRIANDTFGPAARLVDRILKGARLSDLPIEQPTKFELAINLKTAKVLGITVPQTVLGRADEVVE